MIYSGFDNQNVPTGFALPDRSQQGFEAGVITPTGVKKGDPFVAGLNQVSLDIKVFQSIPSPTTRARTASHCRSRTTVASPPRAMTPAS